jgi:hypothetical protein
MDFEIAGIPRDTKLLKSTEDGVSVHRLEYDETSRTNKAAYSTEHSSVGSSAVVAHRSEDTDRRVERAFLRPPKSSRNRSIVGGVEPGSRACETFLASPATCFADESWRQIASDHLVSGDSQRHDVTADAACDVEDSRTRTDPGSV